MSRPTIGLAIIAKNEEDNLPRLFESFEGCFDEVHLTDTGSTDNTIFIAKNLGAQTHSFDWCYDFSAARNFSFESIKSDFIMWLDCDDVLENKDGFLLWRDTVMELADYHMATYHYTTDAHGRAICSFARERVFRKSSNLTWKYPIHEGVLPASSTKMNFTNSWAVRHKRSDEDLKKDRSRNLGIFQKLIEKCQMDPRMQYYYGKELFENSRPKEALPILIESMKHKELELHDRILAMQYTCYAFMQGEEYDRAIDMAFMGLQLTPQRAEFYGVIGDAYLKMGKMKDAVPAYSAAANCTINSSQGSAIFHHEEAYTSYPRNQLSRIYANHGEFDRAESLAKDTFNKYRNEEALAIYQEVAKVKGMHCAFKNAMPCDDIVISCPAEGPYIWDGLIAKNKAMGGSETAAIEMAQHLQKLTGRPVKIFNMREDVLTVDSVQYIPAKKLVDYMAQNKPWLHIAWRHNIKVTNAPTYLWCHDLFTPGGEMADNYEKILALTPFHKRFLMVNQGIPESKIHVTRNGLNPKRFEDTGSFTKDPNKIVFPSSPDRGLDRAMLVMDEVVKIFPKAELHVFYGIEHLHKYNKQDLADKLKAMMAERPFVKYHGATQQDELIKHFKEAVLWLHPCDFIETSCITAMEMICSGVYPVTRRLGGLMDTLSLAEKEGMATLLDHDCITPVEFDAYIRATIKALETRAWEKVKVDPKDYAWENVAREWLRDFKGMNLC